MKSFAFSVCQRAPLRLAAPTLAMLAAFPVMAQSQAEGVLGEVVVTATRFPEPAATLPFGVSVINADDIHAAGVASVNEAVMKLLGVSGRMDVSGGNNYTLDLRGFGVTADSNQVVIVDGLRLNEADQAIAALASIPIDSVESIEILRGTGTVLYGEGATGGVIVVTTKAGAGVKRVNSAQLYAATGSNGLQVERANVVLATGGFSMDVAADDQHSDGHRDNFASTNKHFAVTGQWSNDWLRFGGRVGQGQLDSGLPGSLSAADYATNPRKATYPTDRGSIDSDNSGVFAEASFGDWQLAADAAQRSKKNSGVMWGAAFGYDVDASNYSVRARHDRKLSSTLINTFVIGYDQSSWDSVTTQPSVYKPLGAVASSDSNAFYLKDDLIFASTGTRLSLGWRNENIKKFDGSTNTSLDSTQNAWDIGVSQPFLKDLLVYGRIGTSYRLPNVDELNLTTPGVALKVQTSRDLEVGARWKLSAGQVDVRAYRNNLTDEIGFDGDIYANVNFDPTQRQGVELEVSQAITPALNLRLNAALRQAKFTAGAFAGRDVALVPHQTMGVHASWRPVVGHTLDGGFNWVSSQSPDFANVCKMPSYITVDARYAYQLRNVELSLGLSNLLDVKYYTQAYWCTAAGVTASIYPEPGRVLTAAVRLKF